MEESRWDKADGRQRRAMQCNATKASPSTARDGEGAITIISFSIDLLGAEVLVDGLCGDLTGTHCRDYGGGACNGIASGVDAFP